jgi:ribonuclease HII
LLKNFLYSNKVEAGCDEAGRGCLCGPVCAAAVILPQDYFNPMLNDSKKMTVKSRNLLRKEIESIALDYAVAFVDNSTIDKINILRASILAMHLALDKLTMRPEHILVDGNRFYPYKEIESTCIIRGDGLFTPIAAASVLAKTYRDEFMLALHEKFNQYGWDRNKGYPTKYHKQAIIDFGPTIYHRLTFNLIDRQAEINFNIPNQ